MPTSPPASLPAAVEQRVVQHQDYVRSLARNIARKLPRHVEFEELVALGNVGLLSAARQFEPTRGVAFTTFAYYRIRGAILDGLRQMNWLPPSLKRELTQWSGENEVAESSASAGEVSNDPEFVAKQFATAVGRLGAVYLLSHANEDEEDAPTPVTDKSAAQRAEENEDLTRLKAALDKLPADQAQLIRALYFEQQSMTDLGAQLKKNKSTISRRHTEAIDALRLLLAG